MMMTSTVWSGKRKGHYITLGRRGRDGKFTGKTVKWFCGPGVAKVRGGILAVCKALEKGDTAGLELC